MHQTSEWQDEDPVPFSFHVSLPADAASPGAPTRIVISKSIEADVLSHPTQAFTEEDVLVVHCSPQSVFKVRPATRCSSTLSGDNYTTELCEYILTYSTAARSYFSDPLCGVLANRQYDGNRFRRHKRSPLGSIHRDTLTCTFGSQRMGFMH